MKNLCCHPERHPSLDVGAVSAVGVNKEASPDPSFWERKRAGTAWACDYDNSIIKTTHKTTHSTSRVHVIRSSRLSPRFSAGEEPGYEAIYNVNIVCVVYIIGNRK